VPAVRGWAAVCATPPASTSLGPTRYDRRVIRRATTLDRPWIAETGRDAFADLGDYRPILTAWLEQDHVVAWIAEQRGERRGFSVLGFFEDDEQGAPVADLLAIAVAPRFQGRGLGRALLDHTLAVSTATAQSGRLRELRLCVAHDNLRGQRLYQTSGFRAVDGEFGTYAGGQRAIRMVYPLR